MDNGSYSLLLLSLSFELQLSGEGLGQRYEDHSKLQLIVPTNDA